MIKHEVMFLIGVFYLVVTMISYYRGAKNGIGIHYTPQECAGAFLIAVIELLIWCIIVLLLK